MSRKKGMRTAEELMAALENDPEHLRMRARKDEKMRVLSNRLSEISQPILERLEQVGFPAESIEDLVKKFAPLPNQAVGILVACLIECREERIQESIARALGAAMFPFDGRPLIECLELTTNESLRFAILNTIALAQPHSIEDWLAKAEQNSHLRQTLSELGHRW